MPEQPCQLGCVDACSSLLATRPASYPLVYHFAQLRLALARQRDAARVIKVGDQQSQELDAPAWTALLVRSKLDAELEEDLLQEIVISAGACASAHAAPPLGLRATSDPGGEASRPEYA